MGQLDFRIPVGAFYETHHDLAIQLFGERIEPVNYIGGAWSIRLHDNSETIPAFQIRIGKDSFDDIQREVEAICFLGIDIKPHAGILCLKDQRRKARHHFIQNALFLGIFVARMQCRQLYRNSGVAANIKVFYTFGNA